MMDNTELLERLHEDNLCEAEERLVENNMGLVYGVAKRYNNRGYDFEEIVQVGSIGLIKAIRKFDKNFKVCFSTYAVPLIVGEIKRFLRDDGMIKVSRVYKTNAMRAYMAKEKLTQSLNRTPTIEEVSEECGLKCEEIIAATEATAEWESIYKESSDKDERGIEDKIGVEQEDSIIDKVIIKQSLSNLSSRERKIIVLRYFYDKTQSSIAELFGVSQVQISRIEKKALSKMKQYLNP